MQRDLAKFRAAYHSSAANYDNTAHLTTSDVDLPWISKSNGDEWLAVDLGTESEIESVSIRWGESYARAYMIQYSSDGKEWRDAGEDSGAKGSVIKTAAQGSGRFVRVLCRECSGEQYMIHQIRVLGQNALDYALPPVPAPRPDGAQPLSGGNWRIIRASQIQADGTALSKGGYDDSQWLPAVVPGTALVSFLKAGAIPDPDFDDNQFQISEAYFTADFWYRNSFPIPVEQRGKRVFLNFDAINWKADVYFNGVFLKNELENREHSIEGAFIRAKFDVTELAAFGGENYLAVLIHKNDTPGEVTTQGLAYGPGPNGGALGADNPTIHAAVGWDWLPTIRGRDIGIYGDVSLSYGGDAELVDPWIDTKLSMLSEDSANPAKDLMLGSAVRLSGISDSLEDWRGKEGDAFTIDLGESCTVGSVTLIWGTEKTIGAADLESRHPELFKLESSVDGKVWTNFDAYPGGEVEMRFGGPRPADLHEGTAAFEGHSISDSVQGSTAVVPLDLSFIGRGVITLRIFQPQQARYLRFTVVKRRELNGTSVDTRIRAIRVYAESPEQVEQATKHSYTLDASKAELVFRTEVRNRSDKAVAAQVNGTISPAGLKFSHHVELAPGEVVPVEVPITLDKPHLWWPNTYGEQFLYIAETELLINGASSDTKSFRFGVRRFDYPVDGGLLTLYCNGVRILCKGGNWGLDDGLKRDNAQVLDDKVRLHAEENMTMIRNWVGMTNHPGFYEACDKYGILIWDDFWLANPFDGPEPNDPEMFLENAADKIKAVRSHPALVFYCGRNEGNPSYILNPALTELTEKLDGTRLYFPHSAAAPVGSGGGYALAVPGGNKGVKQYFNDVSSTVIRSERGIPNVPNLESLQRFLRTENLWPISESWALHDWVYHSNGPAGTYMHALQSYLGGDFDIPEDHIRNPSPEESDPVYQEFKAAVDKMRRETAEAWSIEDFSRAAQMINYDSHRGMFDGLSARRANGLLMWMSQSSWPSFMWQTYDFYLDTNGGYFGAKAGNQPTRAVFDPRDDSILLANATSAAYDNVTTVVEIFDLNGALVSTNSYQTELLEADAYGVVIAAADFSASSTDVVFLRLTLTAANGSLLGRNLYWHNRKDYQDYRALNHMPEAEVSLCVLGVEETKSRKCKYTLQVDNGPVPALGVRVRLAGEDGTAVLPVFYSDNYLMMMPGEIRTITAEFDPDRLIGEAQWDLSGWNLF